MIVLLACLLCSVDLLSALEKDGVLLSEAQLQFSTELLQAMAAKDYKKDLVFSSNSIYSTLLTMYLASSSKSSPLIEHVVRFKKLNKPDSCYISHRYFHELPRNDSRPYSLLYLDRVFIHDPAEENTMFGERFDEFVTIRKKKKSNKTKTHEDEINDWVSTHTQGLIKKLFEKGTIKKDNMLMANVGYFRGEWAIPLNREKGKQHFTKAGGGVTKVQFMSAVGQHFKIMTDNDLNAQVILLPFKGERLSMIVILPTTKPTKKGSPPIEHVVKKLNSTKFQALEANLQSQKLTLIELRIPKFKLEETHELKPLLEGLGDKDLFTQPIYLPIYFGNDRPIKINRFVHKAQIDVFENAATAGAGAAEVSYRASPGTNFQADHPFIYIIYDQEKRLIEFMGILNNPK